MGRPIIFFVLLICISNSLNAQQKKAADSSSTSAIGFKKQSISRNKKKLPPRNTNSLPGDNQKKAADHKQESLTDPVDQSKALEIIRIDYNAMPAEVKQKISSNKSQRKPLLDGIAKVFMVEIKTCLTDADQKKTLSFLKTKKQFIQSQLDSPGKVKIIVEPGFDSVDLKDAMLAGGIQFNFLSRSYLLKN